MTDFSAPPKTPLAPTRRTVVAAGVWSVPAIALMSSAPAFAGSAKRAITVSSPGNTAAASGATPLSTSVKTTAGAPLAGEAVSLTGPARSTFAAANGTTNSSGVYTTNFDVNRSWAWPGSTATVTALSGGESGSASLTVLGANAYRVGTGGGRPNVSAPTQEDPVFPSPIKAFSMGMDNVAALLADGTVWTTGANATLLGDGSTGRGTWGKIPSLSAVTNICLSNLHAGAVTSAGELYMWGGNGYGQLGFGNTTALNTPTKVPGMTGVKQVSTGRQVTFVLKNDGTVWAAGWNANSQLGKTGGDSSTFVQIAGLSFISQISGGFLMGGLALKNDGTVWAWGNNGAGQLCDGTTTDSATPKQIPGLTNVKKIQGGSGGGYGASSGYALKNDNTLWAWGVNENGQLGDGTKINRTTPIKFGDNYADVAASTQVVYAIKIDGITLAASGRTKIDALGDVTTPATITLTHPVTAMSEQTYAAYDNQRAYLITAETSVSVDVVQTQVSAGTAGTVNAKVSAGSAGVAGSTVTLTATASAVLGAASGTTDSSGAFQTTVTPDAWTAPGTVVRVDAANDSGAATDTFAVLGANAYRVGTGGGRPDVSGPTQEDTVFPSPITAMSMGHGNAAALLADGTVWTTGGSALLGDGSTTARTTWGKVPTLSGVTNICVSFTTTAAVTSAGELYVWGSNNFGQLGLGSTTDMSVPTKVPGMTGVKQVSTGRSVIFVLKTDGTVWASGWNSNYQLGKTGADSTTFGKIAGLSFISQISGGFLMGGLALKNDGTVWAWGRNDIGQLCDGTTTDSATPKQIPNLTNIKKIQGSSSGSYGLSSGFALQTDNTLWAWGCNDNGQLGDGTKTNRTTPIRFGGDYADVAASTQATYAIKTDGVTLAATGRTKIATIGDVTTPATITLTHPVTAMSEQTHAAYDNQRAFLITGS